MRGQLTRYALASGALLAVVCWAGCTASPLQPDDVGASGDARSGPPIVVSIQPAEGPVGTVVTIAGSGFLSRGNTAKFGSGYVKNLASTDGSQLRFAIPDGLDLCAPDAQGPCPGAYPPVTPGDYVIAITADGRASNSVTFRVTTR